MRPATDAERRALGVPPAYSDVRIAVSKDADLQATAKTPRGKTFYLYSAAFRAKQDAKKWSRVRKLATRVEKIEARIERDARSGENRDVAMTARLILLTGLRNGGASQGEKQSYGASSLRMEHVSVTGSDVRLRFPGKHGVEQDHVVHDALLAAYVAERIASRAATLFPHNAGATLRYMKSVGAAKVHDLRTWRANVLAEQLVSELLKLERPTTKKAVKAFKKVVAERVAAVLGNKPSMALKSYIDPRVWQPIE